MSRSHADVRICQISSTFNAFMLPFKIWKTQCSVTVCTVWDTPCGVVSTLKCTVLVCRRCFRSAYISLNIKDGDDVRHVHRRQTSTQKAGNMFASQHIVNISYGLILQANVHPIFKISQAFLWKKRVQYYQGAAQYVGEFSKQDTIGTSNCKDMAKQKNWHPPSFLKVFIFSLTALHVHI